jgi:hypothetical protein
MDLDSFYADYRAFKARLAPMIDDWERINAEPAISAELHAQINAPLPPSTPMTPLGGDHVVTAASAPIAPAAAATTLAAPAARGESASVLQSGGPTIQQWVAAGYKASAYPPPPYASTSSPEDVAAFQAKEIEAEAAKTPAPPAPPSDEAAAAAALQAEIHKPLPPTAPAE